MTAFFAERAWRGGRVEERVLVEVRGERIAAVTAGADPPAGAVRLPGLTVPGLANAHSHAFHRALRGRTQAGAGDFWAWRDRMYALAGRLDPDDLFDLGRAAYAEMALAGVSAVGEFHYLHHGPSGSPYDDPNATGKALVAAAGEAGVRITLLDACYLRAGLDGRPLVGAQLRFGDGSAEAWAERAGALAADLEDIPTARVGAAVHSVRAVDLRAARTVADWADERGAPLHAHLSEQRAENDDCLAATGRTPAELLGDAGALGPTTTAVHATHLTRGDVALLGRRRASVCLCPTTERDLADGVGPARALADAGSTLCLGSDSHAVVDLFEEARAVELDERLVTERRGHHRGADLLAAATAGGTTALGWDAGRIEPGALADLTAVGLDSPRLAGLDPAAAVDAVVFCATAADVRTVVVGGQVVVRDGHHVRVGDVGRALSTAVARAWEGE